MCMMRLNSGLAAGLMELLKAGMAEGLYHLLSVALQFTVVKLIGGIDIVRNAGQRQICPAIAVRAIWAEII